MWQTILGIIATLGLPALLARQFLAASARRKAEPQRLLGAVGDVLDGARLEAGTAAGVHKAIGTYRGLPVQVQTVADTLATRKLPSLWLMVTIPTPLPVAATLDMMLRAAGPTSFSNFDHLPHTVPTPAGFPETATLRSDDPGAPLPLAVIGARIAAFAGPGAKEFLVTPKGLRHVVLLAEADRARYGVFRQAEFNDAAIDGAQLRRIIDDLIELRQEILQWAGSQP